MKKLLLLALIVFAFWRGYGHFKGRVISPEAAEGPVAASQSFSPRDGSPSKDADSRFRCDGRTHCSHMTSRAEAEFFLRNCPGTKMDGDHDGEPCENDSRF